jgi:hypothetical protein
MGSILKREKGTKTTQQNTGVKTSTIHVPWRMLDLCLRRKRVEREGIYTRMIVTCRV